MKTDAGAYYAASYNSYCCLPQIQSLTLLNLHVIIYKMTTGKKEELPSKKL